MVVYVSKIVFRYVRLVHYRFAVVDPYESVVYLRLPRAQTLYLRPCKHYSGFKSFPDKIFVVRLAVANLGYSVIFAFAHWNKKPRGLSPRGLSMRAPRPLSESS